MLYGRPFSTLDLIFDTDYQAVTYITHLGQVQKALQEYGNKVLLPKENSRSLDLRWIEYFSKLEKRGPRQINLAVNGRDPTRLS